MKRFRLSLSFPWSVVFFLTTCFIYLYCFMEWVFFVTKPSFMSGMSLWLQVKIFFLAALGLSIFPLLLILLLGALDQLIQNKTCNQILAVIGILIPSFLVTSLALILIDNFTYTVFKYGVVSTERLPRGIYGLSFLGLCAFVFFRIRQYVTARGLKKYPVKQNQRLAVVVFLAVSMLLSVVSIFTSQTGSATDVAASHTETLPNIILLGSDGLSATHLSAYGYKRDTTPNINRLLPGALLAENAFPNGGTTAGSVASILTGKLPIETRVIFPPDILDGENSYQHLPGILKRLGYHTVDLSVSYFGDARTLNMQGGFDVANQRSGADNVLVKTTRVVGGGDSAYFVTSLLERLADRLLHIFFLKPMINPYEKVIQPAKREDEQRRFNQLVDTLEQSTAPVFVHVHMLGTHGPKFEIRQQVFSAGQKQKNDWMMDFYDDAIVNFDQYVGELFDYLSSSGKLQNSIVIVYSDHGRMWSVHQRVPLLFWFPNKAYAGRIQANVQNIDIAPTLLDYLGLAIPQWMKGQSLIRKDVQSPEYIFSAAVDSQLIEVSKNGLWVVNAQKKEPPFYDVGYVGLIACDRWFELYLQNPAMLYGQVESHTYSCDSKNLPGPEDAKRILLEHLLRNGYDTSSFPGTISMQSVP